MRSRLTLATLCLAQLMLAVDVTIILVANVTIERSLHIAPVNVQWLVSAYALTFGGFLLPAGKVADRVSQRLLFIAGMLAFALTSTGAGLSSTSLQLIVFRSLQGLAAAVVSPVALSTLSAQFSSGARRKRALAWWSAAASLGGVIGYTAGSLIVSSLGWRWIFFINVPVAAITIAAAWILIPHGPRPVRVERKLDWVGAVAVTLALALVIYGLGESDESGWTSTTTLGALGLSISLLVVFAIVESRAPDPIIPARLLHTRAAIGNIFAAFQAGVVSGGVFLTSLYMQEIYLYSPRKAGIATLPLPIGVFVAATLGRRLGPKASPRRLVGAGGLGLGAALMWLGFSSTDGSYLTTIAPPLLLLGLGLGLASPFLIGLTISRAESEGQGVVAGFYNMSQQVGAAVGLAILVTIASRGSHGLQVDTADGLRTGFLAGGTVAVVAALCAFRVLPNLGKTRERVVAASSEGP